MSYNPYVTVVQAPSEDPIVRFSIVGGYDINEYHQVNISLEKAKELVKELVGADGVNGLIHQMEIEGGSPLKSEAVHGHLVDTYRNGNVYVDHMRVIEGTTRQNFKYLLGLDPNQKYPHPLGWTDDWATLEWLKTDISKF